MHNDRLRQRARKLKVGWTLYGGFTYILAVLIFTLVTGWRNWGAMEYSVVSGGPVLSVRLILVLLVHKSDCFIDYMLSATS